MVSSLAILSIVSIICGLVTAAPSPVNNHHAQRTPPIRRRHAERVRRSPPVLAQRQKSFTLTDKFQGQSFFDGWDFFDSGDPTHGSVEYVNRDKAFSNGLAYVRGDNVAVMKVDNTTFLQEGTNRQSVRISSKKTYNGGLFIVDLLAMPHGCSVWPAFWTVGPNWPSGGEIDILEGVHEQATNQYTLHTSDGCTLDASNKKDQGATNSNNIAPGSNLLSGFTGEVLSTVCNANVNFNAGCGILDSDKQTYGHEFNVNRGGVYAMLWDDSGVRIWFFARGSIPGDIDAGKPTPASWGLAKAFWSSSSCSTNQFFRDHAMVFDITLCGDWAGATYQSAGCPGTCAQRVTDPNNFLYANWQVNYVAVYN